MALGNPAFVGATVPNKIGFELPPQFLGLNVLRKSGFVDQHVDASVIARLGIDNGSDCSEVSVVERSGIAPIRNPDSISRPRQFDGGEESEAAPAVGDEGYPFRHGRVFRGVAFGQRPGRFR